MPLLLEACPRFGPAWRAHREYWEGEEPGVYNGMAELARHLVESFARGEPAEVERAFAVVERVLVEGDEDARGVAVVGLLEDVQTLSSHRSFGKEPFVRLLGPLGRQAWAQTEELWRAGGGSLAGVIRLVSRAANPRRRRWWQFWK